MSTLTMGRLIPPPPRQNKNKLWDRYAKGEALKPTYETIKLKSKIPPPKPIEPRSTTEGKLSLTERILFTSIFFIFCCIAGWFLGKIIGMAIASILKLLKIW